MYMFPKMQVIILKSPLHFFLSFEFLSRIKLNDFYWIDTGVPHALCEGFHDLHLLSLKLIMDRNGVNLWLDRSWALFQCVIATFVSRREKNLMFATTSGLLIFFAIIEVVAVIGANRASLCPLKTGSLSKINSTTRTRVNSSTKVKLLPHSVEDISHCKHCNFIRVNDCKFVA